MAEADRADFPALLTSEANRVASTYKFMSETDWVVSSAHPTAEAIGEASTDELLPETSRPSQDIHARGRPNGIPRDFKPEDDDVDQ